MQPSGSTAAQVVEAPNGSDTGLQNRLEEAMTEAEGGVNGAGRGRVIESGTERAAAVTAGTEADDEASSSDEGLQQRMNEAMEEASEASDTVRTLFFLAPI